MTAFGGGQIARRTAAVRQRQEWGREPLRYESIRRQAANSRLKAADSSGP